MMNRLEYIKLLDNKNINYYKVGTSVSIIEEDYVVKGFICGVSAVDIDNNITYKVYCDSIGYITLSTLDFNKKWFTSSIQAEQALQKRKNKNLELELELN